jgi:lysophospholipase L1-like esterase
MFGRARAAGVSVVAGTIVPYNTATADQNARMREINDWIRRQATTGIAVADTRAAVAAPGMPDALSETADQIHPTAQGYRAMAEVIRPAIERFLR